MSTLGTLAKKGAQKLGQEASNFVKSEIGQAANSQANMIPVENSQLTMNKYLASDERLKNIAKDYEDPIDAISDIDAHIYTYKGDDEEHYGPMAQDLLANPLFSDCVERDPGSGYLVVNTSRLTLALCAAISDICKYLVEIREDGEKWQTN